MIKLICIKAVKNFGSENIIMVIRIDLNYINKL